MKFDVVVIGGGHAGCEAAVASAKLGCQTALLTLRKDRVGLMSCNPAMGGLAKGQLIREIDALGGIMGINTDKTAIQYRRLNTSKGPAVRSSRAQCDKALYALRMQEFLGTVSGLSVLEAEASKIITKNGTVVGIELSDGQLLETKEVIVTTGTFLKAIMHTGFDQKPGGRAGDAASNSLSNSISELGFKLKRLKTGTPPRLHKNSIDFSKLEEQPGDLKPVPFSFYYRAEKFPILPQISCWITYTNEKTHQYIEDNFDQSPMFTGVIKGIGPRYCPSIEDKVKRFRERDRHQIFLEPEGLTTDEIYVNGISTSLPRDVQEKFVRSIAGLEQAEFLRHGYAVEYDAIDATCLKATLESKDISGLFFAGQINGTSGYEEAGAQGLIAGINAALRVQERDPFILSRLDGYIGVLIDDLILKDTDEPYRMFTSRAEFRLFLREDNADIRLSKKGYLLGLLGESEYKVFCEKQVQISKLKESLASFSILPTDLTNEWFQTKGLRPIRDKILGPILLRRPEIGFNELGELGFACDQMSDEVKEQVEIQVKYEGYIQRDLEIMDGVRKNEMLKLPLGLDFGLVPGLSSEVRGRLHATRPETIGQVGRLPGITPAAVANLMIFIKMQEASTRSG